MAHQLCNYLRQNAMALLLFEIMLRQTREALEFTEMKLKELEENTITEEMHGMQVRFSKSAERDKEIGKEIEDCGVEAILASVLDLITFMNKGIKEEIEGEVRQLRRCNPANSIIRKKATDELARLQSLVAAMEVPHQVNVKRLLGAAETTVVNTTGGGSHRNEARKRATAPINRGQKALVSKILQPMASGT